MAEPTAQSTASTSDHEALLRVRGLSKTYQVRKGFSTTAVQALDDVSFDVAPGEVVALVGESGSGKSTTARLIARLEQASAGNVQVEGEDIGVRDRGHAPLSYRGKVQMIFQDPFASLNPVHTIGYHIERPLICHGKFSDAQARRTRALDLLEEVGLAPGPNYLNRYPHETSGGQRQRVAIARALAVEPKLIIADEPTSMLDVSIRIDILNLLRKFKRERNISYLYITHDLATARYFADRIIVLYAGRIVESAPVETVLSNPTHPYTKLLLSSVPDPHNTVSTPLTDKGQTSHVKPAESGCPFAPRCADADAECRRSLPTFQANAAGHGVRCHVYSTRSEN